MLADVLSVAKERHYMVLDPVPQEPQEQKQMVQVYARKKALGGAASVLLSGADRLKNSQAEASRNRTTPDFHIELLRLRQNWRLKKVSNSIIGDLSYRTGTLKAGFKTCNHYSLQNHFPCSWFQIRSERHIRSL